MTATAHVAAATEAARPVTLGRVLKAEWLKFWTLRSTVAVVVGAVVAMVAISLIVAFNTRHITAATDPNDRMASSTLQGYYLGQLLIGALGVLFVSGEYSTGMIRSTLVAVPRRLPVLRAKLIVFVGIVLVAMEAASFIAFLASQALIGQYRTAYTLSSPGALRVVIGTGLYLTLLGVIGGALAWIVRSTPGALVAYVATVLVIPVLFGRALGDWGKHVAEYLPTQAGAAFSTILPDGLSLAPWTGLAVMTLWAVVAVAAGAGVLRKRDA